jgi:hypothetical protein
MTGTTYDPPSLCYCICNPSGKNYVNMRQEIVKGPINEEAVRGTRYPSMYCIYQVCYLRNAVAGAWTGLDHTSTRPLCSVESANFPNQHVRNKYLQPLCQFAKTVMIVERRHGMSRL